MKPVLQETKDSCWRACIASLLETNFNSIPEYFDGNDNWDWRKQQIYLGNEYGIQMVDAVPPMQPLYKETYCILIGPSPRGHDHAIIAVTNGMEGFNIIHDPHPDGGNISDIKSITFLVKAN